jgi:hypothetical protein
VSDLEKAQWLLRMVREKEREAIRAFCDAEVQRCGNAAAANTWDDNNPHDGVGGMSGNPYAHRADTDNKRSHDATVHLDDARELVDFTINRLLTEFVKQ